MVKTFTFVGLVLAGLLLYPIVMGFIGLGMILTVFMIGIVFLCIMIGGIYAVFMLAAEISQDIHYESTKYPTNPEDYND